MALPGASAPPLPLSDEQLAQGLQRGEEACLAALVERHHGPLLGYVYRMCGGDRPLAADLVQDTFLRLIRGIAGYRHPRPFKPWLYAIAVNRVRDHFRSADARRVDSLDESFDAPSDLAADDSLQSEDDARRVARALAGLPPQQREAVVLRYYQDLSLSEIGEALHIPVGTVKSRLSLGLKRLHALLEHDR